VSVSLDKKSLMIELNSFHLLNKRNIKSLNAHPEEMCCGCL